MRLSPISEKHSFTFHVIKTARERSRVLYRVFYTTYGQGDTVHVHRVVLATQSEALSELLPTCPDKGAMNWSAHCNDINNAKVS